MDAIAEMHPAKRELMSDPHGDDVHGYFSLTYADYLVLPRSMMQSMPGYWQRRMVECLEEFDRHFEGTDHIPYAYRVQPVDAVGRFAKHPPHYDRGRAFVPGGDAS